MAGEAPQEDPRFAFDRCPRCGFDGQRRRIKCSECGCNLNASLWTTGLDQGRIGFETPRDADDLQTGRLAATRPVSVGAGGRTVPPLLSIYYEVCPKCGMIGQGGRTACSHCGASLAAADSQRSAASTVRLLILAIVLFFCAILALDADASPSHPSLGLAFLGFAALAAAGFLVQSALSEKRRPGA